MLKLTAKEAFGAKLNFTLFVIKHYNKLSAHEKAEFSDACDAITMACEADPEVCILKNEDAERVTNLLEKVLK